MGQIKNASIIVLVHLKLYLLKQLITKKSIIKFYLMCLLPLIKKGLIDE
jgi:hypothetical protein